MASIGYHTAEVKVIVSFPTVTGWQEHQYEFVQAAVMIRNDPLNQYKTFTVWIKGDEAPMSEEEQARWWEREVEAMKALVEEYDKNRME